MKAWAVALLIGSTAMTGPAFAGVKEGVDAWLAGDYPKAVAEWKAPAAAGDPDAQFNLGQAYKLGRGVPQDSNAATEWYRKAATADHEQAQATLGLQLFQSGKRDEAMTWLKKAADHGEARAQYVVGTAYFNGDSLPKDWSRAYAYMTRAKAQGIGAASTSLTQMDQLIPENQKQSGLAIAKEMERTDQLKMVDQGTGSSPLTMRNSRGVAGGPAPSTVGRADVPASPPSPVPAPSKLASAAPKPVATATIPPPKPVVTAPVKPAPTPAAPKPAAVASSGGKWKIQLGAFSTPGAAQTAWAKMSKSGGLSGLTPFYVPNGAMTRLQAGPFATRAAASQACAAAAGAVTGCFPTGG
ncbi:SPOR domain-containing protein [Sphingomonas montanisoli]|uniref:Sporulation protein n=1 Tax=Sphingomonas montanisoli TaxID=2606412 RepID=A0A5D9CCE5_9SPHN|nr:SPOR domain-containing protein [Sphingomonas montanisoli]TZG28690.1 sporulation protein [Sphingomonas montanisoli]